MRIGPDQFHHFPLNGHEFAMPSAIAAECADRQGRFPEMYRTLYSRMDSIGAKPWDWFGTPTIWVNGEHFTARNVAAFMERAKELGIEGS